MSTLPDNAVATFVQKTFDILSNTQYSSIIQWVHQGRQFIIRQPSTFELTIIPKYFRHKNVHSFIRQLNMYGFHKSRKDPSKFIFSHPAFLQGREELLVQVRRKIREESGENEDGQAERQGVGRREASQLNHHQRARPTPVEHTTTSQIPLNKISCKQEQILPAIRSFDSFFVQQREPQGRFQSLFLKSDNNISPQAYWEMSCPGVSLKSICTDQYLRSPPQNSNVLQLQVEPTTQPSAGSVHLFSTLHYIHDLDG